MGYTGTGLAGEWSGRKCQTTEPARQRRSGPTRHGPALRLDMPLGGEPSGGFASVSSMTCGFSRRGPPRCCLHRLQCVQQPAPRTDPHRGHDVLAKPRFVRSARHDLTRDRLILHGHEFTCTCPISNIYRVIALPGQRAKRRLSRATLSGMEPTVLR